MTFAELLTIFCGDLIFFWLYQFLEQSPTHKEWEKGKEESLFIVLFYWDHVAVLWLLGQKRKHLKSWIYYVDTYIKPILFGSTSSWWSSSSSSSSSSPVINACPISKRWNIIVHATLLYLPKLREEAEVRQTLDGWRWGNCQKNISAHRLFYSSMKTTFIYLWRWILVQRLTR